METFRSFIGLLLDLGTTRRVVELSRSLRRAADGAGWKCSWVPPPNLHVTVKFLGDLDSGLIAPVGDALAQVARRHPPLRLGVAGVGAFPRGGDAPPRVLFAEIHRGHEALASLAAAIDDALFELGLPRESRAFHGHVTLARVKHAPAPLTAIVPTGAVTDCGTGYVGEVTLYRSDLLRQGAEYHVLARVPLTGDRTPAG